MIVQDPLGDYRHHLCDHCGAMGHGACMFAPNVPDLPQGWKICDVGYTRYQLCGGCVTKEATFRDQVTRRAFRG